jgi:hypothetical protein
MLDDEDWEPFTDRHYPLLPALGVSWEEFRAGCYSEEELDWQPVELERDGIFGTPDGIWLPEPAWWECKYTTKKLKPITDCYMYVKQGLSYCAMSGLNRVLYDILWALGDYTRPYKPACTLTLVEFTELEKETWWRIIRKTVGQS